jgi:Ni/Co efflux regulator RcnB
MKRLFCGVAALSLLAGSAMAEPGGDWRPGGHVPAEYRGPQHEVDWRSHHLRQPPRGYHWVQNGNNYVLAAVAGGLIASVIAASR